MPPCRVRRHAAQPQTQRSVYRPDGAQRLGDTAPFAPVHRSSRRPNRVSRIWCQTVACRRSSGAHKKQALFFERCAVAMPPPAVAFSAFWPPPHVSSVRPFDAKTIDARLLHCADTRGRPQADAAMPTRLPLRRSIRGDTNSRRMNYFLLRRVIALAPNR